MSDMHTGGIQRVLTEGRLKSIFMSIFEEMQTLRADTFMREQEAKKTYGKILPLVRGLRFSTLLIYAIRDILKETELKTSWGHLLDENDALCSRECDIIIHCKRHGGREERWNGHKRPVMDFRFIRQQNAIAVISCKLLLKPSQIDKEYCDSMKLFVENVWLFAECCELGKADNVKNKALCSGYDKFWYLYSWNRDSDPEPNIDGWMNFVKELEKLR